MTSIWALKSDPDSESAIEDIEDVGPEVPSGPPAPQQPLQQQPVFQLQIPNNRPTNPPRQTPFINPDLNGIPIEPTPGRKSSLDGRTAPIPTEGPQDSLSLGQLKRIVAGFQRPEKTACYDYTYSDFGTFADEIDEWFVDKASSWERLLNAMNAFNWQWEDATRSVSGMINDRNPVVEGMNIEESTTWDEANDVLRDGVVRGALEAIASGDQSERSSAIGSLTYIVLGRWFDTALAPLDRQSVSKATEDQLNAIVEGISLVAKHNGLTIVWNSLQSALQAMWDATVGFDEAKDEYIHSLQDDMVNLMTILYVAMQTALSHPDTTPQIHQKLVELEPQLVPTLLIATTKRRFDEADLLPQTQLILLLWKAILVVFGGSKELLETKKAASETSLDDKARNLILASPLDYHFFRSEITSKYPAYIPPQSKLPYDDVGKSLLAALANQPQKSGFSGGIIPPAPGTQVGGGSSILNQPVHIATPAPSPPPSPALGGKGAKKQNYQTNQSFPFLYPPLDITSNSAGGKGFAGEQWEVVGRRWEGSDLPASIIEAGTLFSDRVRMSRAMRQMWEEREAFLKEEKGSDPSLKSEEDEENDIESLDLGELNLEEKEELARVRKLIQEEEDEDHVTKNELGIADVPIDFGPNPDEMDPECKRRLKSVDYFYRDSLPHLQSLVIVLLKTIMANVASLPAPVPQSAHPMGAPRGISNVPEIIRTPEEMDSAKNHEVTAKAVTGILILLLKWFKVSHVLKFEYLTQLLLDSNYLPLVLKFFVHQEIPNIVESKTDRTENWYASPQTRCFLYVLTSYSFFHMCNVQAKNSEREPTPDPEPEAELESGNKEGEKAPEGSSEDDAMPPPIKRRRSPPLAPLDTSAGHYATKARPEVDELGFPVNSDVPLTPVTDFSRRNFFSLINYLRILQKICKGKVHRNLLMVTYKSSNILRKSLRVPQDELRLYTLKLIKSQVPYCGRKWRQGHMRVITAIYLHCRPELRDEWLAGSDVDGEIESALPLEQALRSLTHWSNVRRYPEMVAAARGVRAAVKAERDFFAREVERLAVLEAGPSDDGQGGSNGK
ncbi:hypothetical protein TD95_000502 [Thielaviopsis punctulata]|uniref:Far11/STRP C-terminal domain-containing protein n=1 Tax=Thielaviopsis punctulata TaxID=72032 RepID=A0A0F4ZAQ1_9PEZI|nr:hypothetical protein TD95_000502 [Thielaviopsis punctulata]